MKQHKSIKSLSYPLKPLILKNFLLGILLTVLITSSNITSFTIYASKSLDVQGTIYFISAHHENDLLQYYNTFAADNKFHIIYGESHISYLPVFSVQRNFFQLDITFNTNNASLNKKDIHQNITSLGYSSGITYSSKGFVRMLYVISDSRISNEGVSVISNFYCYSYNVFTETRQNYFVLNASKYNNSWSFPTWRYNPCSQFSNSNSVFFLVFSNYINGTIHLYAITIDENSAKKQLFKLSGIGIIDPVTFYVAYNKDNNYYWIIFQNDNKETFLSYYFPDNNSLAYPVPIQFSVSGISLFSASKLFYDERMHNLYLLTLVPTSPERSKLVLFRFNSTALSFEFESVLNDILFASYKNVNGVFISNQILVWRDIIYFDTFHENGTVHILASAPKPFSTTEYNLYEITYELDEKNSWNIKTIDLPESINPIAASYFYNFTSKSYINGTYNVFGVLNDDAYPIPSNKDTEELNLTYFLICHYLYGLNFELEPYFLNYSLPSRSYLPLIISVTTVSIVTISVAGILLKTKRLRR